MFDFINRNYIKVYIFLFLQNLDIRLKWPNDIYANGCIKLGGLIVNTELNATMAVCNVGVGFNFSNSNPTICLNDLVKAYNVNNNTNLPYLQYEQFFALVFNEIERLINEIQSSGDFSSFLLMYYRLWLHSDAEVTIVNPVANTPKLAKIIGIDDYGYLLVQPVSKQQLQQPETVQPDGNSFDMLRGLISTKRN